MTHLKHAAFALAMLTLVPLSGCGNDAITADQLAAELNKRTTFPQDLGEGFRLDSITAEGNTIVSTVTLADPALASDPGLVEVMRVAAKSDICREIAPARQAYTDAGLSIAKVFNDASGAQIVRVDVQPADCE